MSAAELNNLPYRAEYAKTGRASCKGCKNPIEKGVLRLAILTTSRFHDGKDANWHHVDCFFAKAKPQSTGDFGHFESLRWEDQEMIKKRIGSGSQSKTVTDIKKETKKDYKVEYAKSKASKCVACEEKIDKDTVRVGKMDYLSERAMLYAPFFRWHHIDCFVKIRNEPEVGFYDSGNNLPGYMDLDEPDKAMIKSKLPVIPTGKRKLADEEASGSKPSKLSKTDTSKNGKDSKADPMEEKIKVQNKEIYKYRDLLEKNLKRKDFSRLLSYNKQEVPSGDAKMLDRLSDIMTFGALLPCKTCKSGQFVYRSGVGYQCMGHLTEFTTCGEVTEDPARTKFKLPQEYKEVPDLQSYSGKVKKRIIPKHAAPVQAKVVASIKQASATPKINSTPLKGFKVAIDEKFAREERENMTARIESFGGKLQQKPSKNTAFFISTKEVVKSCPKHMKKVKEMEVPVVSKEFVNALSEVKYNLSESIKGYLISDWVDDIRGRLITLNGDFEKTREPGRSVLEKEMSKQKLQMKGGAVVDPDSGLENKGHILKMPGKGKYYNVVLNRVDIEADKNSFYKLQVIESDRQPFQYWLFRGWGRIGTTQGGVKIDEDLSKSQAIELFEELFQEQTANVWGQTFAKKPGKYISLEIDYSETEKVNKIVPSTSKSALPFSVQELICLIFDIDKMKQTLIEFEIDMEKMPLGKISRQQILKAYLSLNDALKIMEEKSGNSRMLLDASNRFFSLIPHNFGLKSVPILDNDDIIKSKIEMLDNLLEIELAYQLLREGESEDGSVDTNYKKLNAAIDILENNSEEYKILQRYLENTHASTHDSYTLQIDQIFKVARSGEKKRYRPFKQLHNRKLLWHGSRTTNYVGILSQGLRIAPPEAPVTGYMFGKGIYFADMVSKSANYCFTSPDNNTGLLMLCEVALGDVHERTDAKESLTKPPNGAHSVKGCGSTQPDPEEVHIFSDGVEVPFGKSTKSKRNTSLLYNEYIVYDVAQVNIRYLLKVNFKYKGRR